MKTVVLYNPTDEKVKFCYGGKWEYFDPKESKTFPEHKAMHAIKRAKVPLVEYNPSYDNEMTSTDMNYSEMPWKNLVSLGSARGIYKPGKGSNREALEGALEEYDKTRGTLQKPSDKEEESGA